MSFITGVGLTSFGRHEGSSTLDLMSRAAELAIADAGLKRGEIDGVLCGYTTIKPHIMLATVFAEHFGIKPSYAHAVQVGGATGLAMTMLAHTIVDAGVARHVLVVSGENRLTGQSRDAAIQTLAQVGHPDYEVPLGPTIPAYYGLVASRYMHEYGVTQEDLAEFAVLMRDHAVTHPGAQFHDKITVADVMASKPVAMPLKLLDCCPVSDGGVAFVISRERTGEIGVRVLGCAQAHTHQHVTAMPALSELGAEIAIARAKKAAGVEISDVRYAAVYDSFTITLAMLLEDLGLAGARRSGGAGARWIFQPRRRHAAQYPWRPAQLRPLRRRRCDGASGGNPAADDRARRQSAGEGCVNRAVAWRRRCAVLPRQHVPGAGAMSDQDPRIDDWTTGAEAIVYQSCAACGSRQYFRRNFCAACGAPDPQDKRAGGEGIVYATSLVVRAATPEARAHVPYNIVLVDTAEGFRMMAHGDNDLKIGDRVTAQYRRFTDRLVPYFTRTKS